MISTLRPLIAALLAFVFFLACLGCARADKEVPVAKDGVLDLSDWDAARDGPVTLNGQWEFYWDQLLTPEDFRPGVPPPQSSDFLPLPSTWKGHMLHGKSLPGRGQATFRLRLLPGPENLQLALRIIGIHAAYRLWADGRLIAESGVVGRSPATESPHRSLVLAKCTDQGVPVELILQVSNHSYRRGGLLYPILLGLPDQLGEIHIRVWSWGMLFVGSLLIMAVYHLVLYFLKRKEASTLYFSLGCLLLICYYITADTSDWLVDLFVQKTNPEIILKISLMSYAILSSVIYRFYRSLYPLEFYCFVQHLSDIRNIIFIYIVLTQPNIVIYTVLHWFASSTVLLNAYFLVMLLVCVRRGRDGAIFLLLGYFSLSVATLSEIYGHILSFSEVSFLPFGLLGFVLFQALAMALRFSNAFTVVENLSKALESNNTALRAEIDERTRLEQEIVNVSEEERRRMSHDLHDGLCQQLAGTRLRCKALARHPIAEPRVATEVSEISSLLQDSVSMAYDLSRGLWPVEHDPGDVGASLDELARRVARASGVDIQYFESLSCASCRDEHLVQLFRIAQEAVTNAVKHAKPGRIDIALGCGADQRLVLSVRDDGIGRQATVGTEGGLGMRIMAYRARMIGATLSIDNAKGGGTLVLCSLPCRGGQTTEEDADG